MKKSKISFWGGLIVAIMGSCLAMFSVLAYGPNRDLHFEREIKSDLERARINRNIESTTRWPQWFYSLDRVESEDSGCINIHDGCLLTLKVDPKKAMSKRFTLKTKVLSYIPNQILKLEILEDSSGRLTRLFDRLEWTVELQDGPKGTLIKGTSAGHTAHWRSRFFGRLAEKILMNQIFYPNLIQLADLRQPFEISPGVTPPPITQ